MYVAIGLGDSAQLRRSKYFAEVIRIVLYALVAADRAYLKTHPTCPLLYDSGVVYKNETPAHITTFERQNKTRIERFDDIPTCMQRGWADCFPEGTLLLTEGHKIVRIEDVKPGTKIWGLHEWTPVEAKTFKGTLDIDAVRLNNGSTLCLTEDHKVYVLECPEHGHCEKLCSCPPEARREVRMRVKDLEPGMVLATPKRLPFGSEAGDPDRAYVEGLYVSDGWSDKTRNNRFSISGKDGFPKEDQKHEVERIAKKLGMPTTWHERYITVNDPDWAVRMQLMGGHAPEKRILDLNLNESMTVATVRGVMADSGKNSTGPGRTFTTTSRELSVQMRVLHKMLGRTCGYSHIENHGGLGKNPIYRLNVRQKSEGVEKQEKLLRVSEIERSVGEAPCWDIQTGDHKVYLPEHDVTVSNCDDIAPWRVAELRERFGEEATLRVTWKKFRGRKVFHIQVRRADGTIEDPCVHLGMPTGDAGDALPKT